MQTPWPRRARVARLAARAVHPPLVPNHPVQRASQNLVVLLPGNATPSGELRSVKRRIAEHGEARNLGHPGQVPQEVQRDIQNAHRLARGETLVCNGIGQVDRHRGSLTRSGCLNRHSFNWIYVAKIEKRGKLEKTHSTPPGKAFSRPQHRLIYSYSFFRATYP